MGGGRAQNSLICGILQHIGPQTQLGADDADNGMNVQESWFTDEYGKEKGDGF